jgi:hypothetical protein
MLSGEPSGKIQGIFCDSSVGGESFNGKEAQIVIERWHVHYQHRQAPFVDGLQATGTRNHRAQLHDSVLALASAAT